MRLCEDAPACGCCGPENDYVSPELAEELEAEWEENHFDDSMDGAHDSAMASAGFGTDEDYGFFGEDMLCEGYDEH